MSAPLFPTQSKKSYLSMGAYQDDFFSYVTSNSGAPKYESVGSLTAVTGATSGNCPAGRYLYETGRKLYPGGSYPGISTLMVDVIDPVTGLKGFIDPNSYAFTNFSSDRPAYLETGIPVDNATNPRVGALNPDQGAPVYTNGDIIADGNLTVGGTGTYGNTILTTYGQIRSSALFTSTFGASSGQNNLAIDPTAYQVVRLILGASANNNVAITVSPATLVGAQLFFSLSNATASSRVFDFNTGFLSSNVGQHSVAASATNSASFFCDGSSFIQVGGQSTITQ